MGSLAIERLPFFGMAFADCAGDEGSGDERPRLDQGGPACQHCHVPVEPLSRGDAPPPAAPDLAPALMRSSE